MSIQEILELAFGIIAVIGWVWAIIQKVVIVCKIVKEKKWNELCNLLENEIVPLMEEAEKNLTNGAEKEDWVIKKLANKLHIDFFKYENILNEVKSIIKDYCTKTKTEINKTIFKAENEDTTKLEDEVKTNGIL